MESQEGTYIRFEKAVLQNPKTQIWNVIAKQDNFMLGQVKWFGRWRKYSFFPNKDTVFENVCLMEIAEFIEYLMEYRSQVAKFKGWETDTETVKLFTKKHAKQRRNKLPIK